MYRISTLVRNRHVFLAVMTVISAAKLCLCAIEPASFDLRDTIDLVNSSRNPLGPWLALYPPLFGQISNSTQLQAWWLTPPPSMDASMQMISLLFRLPVFAFDLATAIVLYYTARRLASPVEGRLVSLVWFLNPLCLFSVELLAVPDVAATFLIILAFSLLVAKRPILGGIVMGLGVWIKFFPILLFPPLLLYAHVNGVSRRGQAAVLCFGLAGLAGYLSWILPFGSYYMTLYTPVTQPFPFVAGISAVNGSAFVLIFFYCLLGLFARRTENLLVFLLPTLLVYYAISNPYPQYLIWAIPLMALDLALVKRLRAIVFAIFNVFAFAQWFLTSSGFLTPSGYSLLMIPLGGINLPWYSLAITRLLDNYVSVLLLPLVSSFFYASILVYAVDIARSWFDNGSLKSRKQ